MQVKSRLSRGLGLPHWAPVAALVVSLAFAWLNFVTTARWADLAGALNGWKQVWYAVALVAATTLVVVRRRQIGQSIPLPWPLAFAVLTAGAGVLVSALLSKLPPSSWHELLFKDNWTMLFQQAANGVALLKRGVVVGWNWSMLGGYPTSTDIAQNFGTVAFLPMALLGESVGYHVLHIALFCAVPIYVWLDLRHDGRRTAALATGFAALFAAGFLWTIGSSGDTNSLVGVACAGLALTGSRGAALGRRWGGPVQLLGLTLAAYSHSAFYVYAVIYLAIEAVYFRDRPAARRLLTTAAVAAVSSLPAHFESLWYREYVSFNNTVYDPGAPVSLAAVARLFYYNLEILVLPHRWFNDYRSLANVWLPVLVVTALAPGRSRPGFYAWAALATQLLLRFNSPSLGGAMFDRIQHMFPLLMAPALAGFIVGMAGTRALAAALSAVIGLYVATSYRPVPHVPDLRAFNPALMDRIAASDGMVLVEISPHRDMDRDPVRRTPTTPFDVHFEGLLPRLAGQRFYSQMIDGWVWNRWRGQVVAAGTFEARPLTETPHDRFAGEMHKWGVRHLFVWTDLARDYLARDSRYVERWRDARWSHFERVGADTRSVVTASGRGELREPDFLGASVVLDDQRQGDRVTVRANFYPAWRAYLDATPVPLVSDDGQLAFDAPREGSYVVRLEYPRYTALNVSALVIWVAAMFALAWRPGPATTAPQPPRPAPSNAP